MPAPLFVLIHSPFVGPATWRPVADVLLAQQREVVVPSLLEVGLGDPPYWPRVVDAVRGRLADVPPTQPVVLVAHSNAGVFVPVISVGLLNPIAGSVFVDAALPALDGPTPVGPKDKLPALRQMAGPDGQLPIWTDWYDEADVASMFPDPEIRLAVTKELPRLPLAYFEQAVPVPPGWHDHPSAYVLFGPPYDRLAGSAAKRGWDVFEFPGAHLHQAVDPEGLTDIVLGWVEGR
jgi:hypothetical protein